jgi:hypothetical protein
MPPDRKLPSGTSEIMRRSTASSIFSRNVFCASLYEEIGSAIFSGIEYQRSIRICLPEISIKWPGSSF